MLICNWSSDVCSSDLLPLAMIFAARGSAVSGSDRSRDQGRTPEKFSWLERQGIEFFPQDGSRPQAGQILVASAAIEDSVPDVAAANALGLPRMTRDRKSTRLNSSH